MYEPLTRRALTVCIVAVGLALPPSAVAGQELTAPYSFDELSTMLAGPQSQERIASLVTEGCIDFQIDAFVILDLRDLGAGDDLIAALNDACVIEPGSEPDPAPAAAPTRPSPAVEEDEPVVVRSGSSSRGLTGSGFYGSDAWFRLRYSSVAETKSAGAAWATMMSGAAEFGLWGTGAQTITNDVVAGESTFWDAETGMLLNLFLLQPRGSRPLGLYVGGLAGFGRSWLDGQFGDGLNRYQYGWEAGAFGRVGTDKVSFVPRIARRSTWNRYISDLIDEPIVVKTTVVGAEVNLSGFVPGVFVHITEGTSVTVISLTFAF